MNTTGLDIQVRDQDEVMLPVTDTYRGHEAIIVHVTVEKPEPQLPTDDVVVAIAAALLGKNLARDVRAIAIDVEKEFTKMGYELRSIR